MKRYVDLDEILLALPKSAAKIIEDWPLADVQEVRHGKWERTSTFHIFCSECCAWLHYEEDETMYCPYCGARMDRE